MRGAPENESIERELNGQRFQSESLAIHVGSETELSIEVNYLRREFSNPSHWQCYKPHQVGL